MFKYIPVAALLLAGCVNATAPTTTATTAPQTGLQQLASFTIADLQEASADAKAQTPPDVTASQCYDFLLTVLPSIQTGGAPATVGAFFAFQKARDIATGVTSSSGVLKSLNLACAPLVIDTQVTVNNLALLGAGNLAIKGIIAP